MASPISNRLTQVAAKIGTEGAYSALVEAAAYANFPLLADPVPKIIYDVDQYDRNPVRGTFGTLASIPGRELAVITFKIELKGSGTAGVAPSWGRLLRACGFSETVNTGVASNTSPVADPTRPEPSTVPVSPAISGTFTGTKSGIFRVTLTTIVASTSAAFDIWFFPGDGTAATKSTTSHTSAVAQSIGQGLSMAITNPTGGTATWYVGQQWFFRAVSDQAVNVIYQPISTSLPVLDFAIYQVAENGTARIHKVHSARGNMKLQARLGEPAMLEFEFRGVPQADPADGAILSAIPFEDVVPPVFQGVTATLDGSALQCFTAFDMDLGNTIAPRQCATEARGYESVRINARKITGNLDPEAVLIADFDPFSKLFDGTTDILQMIIGSASGNIIQIDAPRVQVTNLDYSDRDNLGVDNLELRFCEPEFDAGGDYAEMTITVS